MREPGITGTPVTTRGCIEAQGSRSILATLIVVQLLVLSGAALFLSYDVTNRHVTLMLTDNTHNTTSNLNTKANKNESSGNVSDLKTTLPPTSQRLTKTEAEVNTKQNKGREIYELVRKTGKFEAPLNESSLTTHRASGQRCYAVCMVGLTRTLRSAKVYQSIIHHLLGPLSPCVDVYWVVELKGTGARPIDGFEVRGEGREIARAITAIRPRYVKILKSGWRGKWRHCFDKVHQHVSKVRSQSSDPTMVEYEWVIRTRTDVLYYKNVTFPELNNNPRTKLWRYSSIFDFFEMQSDPLHKPSKGRDGGLISLDTRICRPNGEAQRRVDAYDLMWQNLLPLAPNPPNWFRSYVPLKVKPIQEMRRKSGRADLLFRTLAVVCFRVDLLTKFYGYKAHCGLSEGYCNQGTKIKDWHYKDRWRKRTIKLPKDRCKMGTSALSELKSPNPRRLQEILMYAYHAGEHLTSNMGESIPQQQHWMCTCADFKEFSKQSTGDVQMLRYYDHSSLECNDSMPHDKILARRKDFQKMSLLRASNAIESISKWSNVTRNLLYAEMAIFCDVYRYNHDLIGPSESMELRPLVAALNSLIKRLKSPPPSYESDRVDAWPLRQILSDGLRHLDPRAGFRDLCRGMGLFDGFRMKGDLNS
mmetsp:Transcript_20301/g.32173  ORF Transcript_20301/g.32173 Transcript_20301/m.32173 type:complete len:644 (-) Transcript_20301:132-2063(-)